VSLLHNMSSPPRTSFEVKGTPVSVHVTVFSLTYALAKSGSLKTLIPGGKITAAHSGDHLLVRDMILKHISDPKALFSKIGDPVYPDWHVDFLVGWRASEGPFSYRFEICTDPRLSAGVLSKCAGTLYLSKREPELTWDQLLALPLAFDENLIKLS